MEGNQQSRAQKEPDAEKAKAMLAAFGSVGANVFDVTLNDHEGNKTAFQPGQGAASLRQTIARRLKAATAIQQNVIIRPRSRSALLVQLDDLSREKARRVDPFAFMVIETSAGNFQAWLAVKDAPRGDEAAKDLGRRIRKAAGADLTASGATRIAGSLNFKTKYAPAFPIVEIRHTRPGKMTTATALDAAGLLAPEEIPRPAAPALSNAPRECRRRWPDYRRCLDGAPLAHDGKHPDVSRADFTWCRTAIEWGWSATETARRLMQLSAKAKQDGQGYATLTVSEAAKSVERNPHRRRSTPAPS